RRFDAVQTIGRDIVVCCCRCMWSLPLAGRYELATYRRRWDSWRYRIYHVNFHCESRVCWKCGDHERFKNGHSFRVSDRRNHWISLAQMLGGAGKTAHKMIVRRSWGCLVLERRKTGER